MSTSLPLHVDLVIVGAGPIGLEAALAAAEHGLSFAVFESGKVPAAVVRSWGHVRMFTPWDLSVSPRARRALKDLGGSAAPAGHRCPTGLELCERVLEPLARSPKLHPHIFLGARVLAIGRCGLIKREDIGGTRRAQAPFRVLVDSGTSSQQPNETVVLADTVFDCTGSLHRPLWLGDGGIPAPGERALSSRIGRALPDIEKDAPAWAGRSILLAGSGHSAQTAAVALARLAENAPSTRVIWVLRGDGAAIAPLADDALPDRAALHAAAQSLVRGLHIPAVEVRKNTVVSSVETGGGHRLRVFLQPIGEPLAEPESVEVDRVLALVGSIGDHELYRELQVHECYATGGPMALAASLLGESSDCMAQGAGGAELLLNPEPGFFILGSKSYGRNSAFLLRVGWQQVDDALSLQRDAAKGKTASGPVAVAAERPAPIKPRRRRAKKTSGGGSA